MRYEEIAQEMLTGIENGKYTDRLPTIDTLAKEFSVSKMTMQRAIGVLKENNNVTAVPKRGIFVTRLKRARSHVIGVLLRGTGYAPLHEQLIRGMENEATGKGEMVAVVRRKECSQISEVDQIKQMIEKQKVDGIIIWPVEEEKGRYLIVDYLVEQDIPFVVVPEADPEVHSDCHTVSSSQATAAHDVMMHLIGNGHQNIGFVSDEETYGQSFALQRYEQYRKCMELAGLKQQKTIPIAEIELDIRILEKYSALFCVTDSVAVHVVRQCLEHGVSIPNDIAVVGYDNTHVAWELELSSVEQHFEKIGQLAVDLLLKDINEELDKKQHLSVESELVIRKSTKKN